MQHLVCISHLRWDFVWQRPQHLLSRLATHHPVLFVEEPVTSLHAREFQLDVRQEPNNITVIRLVVPADHDYWIGHGDAATALTYQRLLREYMTQHGIERPLLWLYTPMAWHFVEAIPHRTLIYDVMDELAAFKGAPAALHRYEQLALSRADIVFTGGVSLYQNKKRFNDNTHLFPSGVEVEHFARAAERTTFLRPADLPAPEAGPVFGYYGVIDERMDIDLLRRVALARPHWQMAVVGPIVKIDPADLPRLPNLHYPGMKTYQELPAYLAHFDVALIPFAINEATRYLSPTKTLEYMAAHKPIISTPIRDVATLYGSVVRIAATPEDFILQGEAALQADHRLKLAQETELLQQHTWDSIVSRMKQQIDRQQTPTYSSRIGEAEREQPFV